MKILLNTFGTPGDNLPFLAVARALAVLGHEPLLALNPVAAPGARALGLPVVPVGAPWDIDTVSGLDRYVDPTTGGIAIWRDICLPNIAPTFREIGAIIERERPDALLAHFLCHGALWAARAAGVPRAVATLAPCWWVSREIPPVFAPMVPPRWLHRPLTALFKPAVNWNISRTLRPVCAELGQPFRDDEYFRPFAEAGLNLGLWSPALRPAASDDPAGAVLTGFPFLDAGPPPPLDPAVAAFLDAGPPPVVVGLGTSARRFGHALFPDIAAACARLGRRALLIGSGVEGLPGDTLTVPAAPFSAVFPRAAAIMHHGGVGTTAEALRAGRPAVIVPFTGDQFDNALLCERAGLSLTLKRTRLGVDRVERALRAALGSEPMIAAAAATGERIRAEPPGARAAAEHLVRFAAGAS